MSQPTILQTQNREEAISLLHNCAHVLIEYSWDWIKVNKKEIKSLLNHRDFLSMDYLLIANHLFVHNIKIHQS